LNTQVLSHSTRRTRLLWPLRFSDKGVCSSEGTARVSFHTNVQTCTVRSQNRVIFKLSGKSPNPTTKALKWPRLQESRYPCLRFVYLREFQGLWLATFLPVQRGADLARLKPMVKRAQSDWRVTVTLVCPRWGWVEMEILCGLTEYRNSVQGVVCEVFSAIHMKIYKGRSRILLIKFCKSCFPMLPLTRFSRWFFPISRIPIL
jgi:hypothetical protein